MASADQPSEALRVNAFAMHRAEVLMMQRRRLRAAPQDPGQLRRQVPLRREPAPAGSRGRRHGRFRHDRELVARPAARDAVLPGAPGDPRPIPGRGELGLEALHHRRGAGEAPRRRLHRLQRHRDAGGGRRSAAAGGAAPDLARRVRAPGRGRRAARPAAAGLDQARLLRAHGLRHGALLERGPDPGLVDRLHGEPGHAPSGRRVAALRGRRAGRHRHPQPAGPPGFRRLHRPPLRPEHPVEPDLQARPGDPAAAASRRSRSGR